MNYHRNTAIGMAELNWEFKVEDLRFIGGWTDTPNPRLTQRMAREFNADGERMYDHHVQNGVIPND
jgi:hypothetical protein